MDALRNQTGISPAETRKSDRGIPAAFFVFRLRECLHSSGLGV